MIDRTLLADGSVLLSTPESASRVQQLAPGVVLCSNVGRGAAEVDLAVMAELEQHIERSGSISVFCDLRSLTRMDPATRETASLWGKKHYGKVSVHILVTSKLVELALSVISMVVGTPIRFYGHEAGFLAALERQVPGVRSLPVVPLPGAKRAG